MMPVPIKFRVRYSADSRGKRLSRSFQRRPQMFRLKKKHSPKQQDTGPPPNAALILVQQSVGRAVAGGSGALLVFDWLWASMSMQTGRIYPWLSVLIGALIGLVVRLYGRGLDWRFPLIAALFAWAGAYAGNLMIAILETGRYIEAKSFSVFLGLSKDTIENFFANTVSPIDHIYAFCAAGVASFLAKRRLKRREVLVVRKSQEDLH